MTTARWQLLAKVHPQETEIAYPFPSHPIHRQHHLVVKLPLHQLPHIYPSHRLHYPPWRPFLKSMLPPQLPCLQLWNMLSMIEMSSRPRIPSYGSWLRNNEQGTIKSLKNLSVSEESVMSIKTDSTPSTAVKIIFQTTATGPLQRRSSLPHPLNLHFNPKNCL